MQITRPLIVQSLTADEECRNYGAHGRRDSSLWDGAYCSPCCHCIMRRSVASTESQTNHEIRRRVLFTPRPPNNTTTTTTATPLARLECNRDLFHSDHRIRKQVPSSHHLSSVICLCGVSAKADFFKLPSEDLRHSRGGCLSTGRSNPLLGCGGVFIGSQLVGNSHKGVEK